MSRLSSSFDFVVSTSLAMLCTALAGCGGASVEVSCPDHVCGEVCCANNQVCDATTSTCVAKGCTPACAGDTPDCDATSLTCRCNDSSCGSGEACVSGACQAVAATCDPSCSGETPDCDAATLTCRCNEGSCGSGKACVSGTCEAVATTCDPACSGETPDCDATMLTCRCNDGSCGSGTVCVSGACQAVATTCAPACTGATPVCFGDTATCGCSDTSCGTGNKCNPTTRQCAAACSPGCSGATPDCDTASSTCVCNETSCASGQTCGASGKCVAATCSPACAGETPSCNAATKACQCTGSSCGSGKVCTGGVCVTASSATTEKISDIVDAATRVEKFAQTNSRLPNYVAMGTSQVDMPAFLMLEVTAIGEINAAKSDAVELKTFAAPAAPKDTTTSGQMPEAEYLKIAGAVQSSMASSGKAPDDYSPTSLGTDMGFDNLVYSFAKILAFDGANQRLPSYVTLDLFCKGGVTVTSTGWNVAGPYNFDYEDANYDGYGEVTCGPTSLEMLFSELAGGVTKMGQDAIAKIAGTGSNGTAPDDLVAAAVTVGKDIGIPVTAYKSSFAAIGWQKTAQLVKDPSKGIVFHIMTGGLPGWSGNFGHYVFPVGVNLGTSTVRIADPIKGVHEYSFSAYEGAMNAISAANQTIVVEKK